MLEAGNSDLTPLDSHPRRAKNKGFGSCDNDSSENKNMYTQTYIESLGLQSHQPAAIEKIALKSMECA